MRLSRRESKGKSYFFNARALPSSLSCSKSLILYPIIFVAMYYLSIYIVFVISIITISSSEFTGSCGPIWGKPKYLDCIFAIRQLSESHSGDAMIRFSEGSEYDVVRPTANGLEVVSRHSYGGNTGKAYIREHIVRHGQSPSSPSPCPLCAHGDSAEACT